MVSQESTTSDGKQQRSVSSRTQISAYEDAYTKSKKLLESRLHSKSKVDYYNSKNFYYVDNYNPFSANIELSKIRKKYKVKSSSSIDTLKPVQKVFFGKEFLKKLSKEEVQQQKKA